MTMTRAFDELEVANLGEVTTRGRERRLRFTGRRQEIWTKAQQFLHSPVTKRVFIRRSQAVAGGIRAGLTALTQYSMLTPPAYTTYALSREDWKILRQRHKAAEVPTLDGDAHEIEVWSYPPALFAERDIVDSLSLYLSLKADRDERTEGSLDEMMRKLGWQRAWTGWQADSRRAPRGGRGAPPLVEGAGMARPDATREKRREGRQQRHQETQERCIPAVPDSRSRH